MKKHIILFAVLVLLAPVAVFSATFKAGDSPGVGSSEKVMGDLYVAGGNVAITGAVTGDLYTVGGSVLVSGPVSQDFVAGGGNITLTGDVGDDIKAGGGTLVIQGGVGDDAFFAGGQVTLSGKQVGGDLIAAGGVVRVESPIRGNVRIAGGEVYLNSTIAGNVRVDADKLELGPKAVVNGNFVYRSSKEMTADERSKIVGEVSYEPIAKRVSGKNVAKTFYSFWIIARALMILVLALVVGLVFKRFSVRMIETADKAPWAVLGKGLITVIILPIASILLFVTVVGAPFGVLGIISIVALATVGCAFAPIFMGTLLYRWITKKDEYEISWKVILLGVVVFVAIGFIPFIGWLVKTLFGLAAIGTLVTVKWQIAKEWR